MLLLRDRRYRRQTVGTEEPAAADQPLVFRTVGAIGLRWRKDNVATLGAHIDAVPPGAVSASLGVLKKEVRAARRCPAYARRHALPVGQRRVAILPLADIEVDHTEAGGFTGWHADHRVGASRPPLPDRRRVLGRVLEAVRGQRLLV